ncbi:MAG: GntR family transcriptional regulator [Anaerotruncus colihominis]
MSELVALGALAPGEQLPSVRALARDLGINPNTVQKAYQELERRGVLLWIRVSSPAATAPADAAIAEKIATHRKRPGAISHAHRRRNGQYVVGGNDDRGKTLSNLRRLHREHLDHKHPAEASWFVGQWFGQVDVFTALRGVHRRTAAHSVDGQKENAVKRRSFLSRTICIFCRRAACAIWRAFMPNPTPVIHRSGLNACSACFRSIRPRSWRRFQRG